MRPLADVLRPTNIDEIIGQSHILGNGAPLRRLIESKQLPNIILYGPPGIGKSTIANIIAEQSGYKFVKLNATSFTVKELRKYIDNDERTLIYIDEIYRLSSNQADVLLPATESGHVILVGATTENPFHTLKASLISRSQIFELTPLSPKELAALMKRAIDYYKYNDKSITIDRDAAKYLIKVSCGDARKLLSILETVVAVADNNHIDEDIVKLVAPNKYHVYSDDKKYDLASAIQGSIQASDPDSAVYFLALALESGEDPRYIARRILVSASEDAASNPICVAVAQSAYLAAHEVGRPECDIIMAHAVTQIASSPRDKSAANAIWEAVKDVRKGYEVEIPKEMRDCHYAGAKVLGNGQYAEGRNPEHYIGVNKRYYRPEEWIDE